MSDWLRVLLSTNTNQFHSLLWFNSTIHFHWIITQSRCSYHFGHTLTLIRRIINILYIQIQTFTLWNARFVAIWLKHSTLWPRRQSIWISLLKNKLAEKLIDWLICLRLNNSQENTDTASSHIRSIHLLNYDFIYLRWILLLFICYLCLRCI